MSNTGAKVKIDNLLCEYKSAHVELDGCLSVTFTANRHETQRLRETIDVLQTAEKEGKIALNLSIKNQRKKRSLDANAYLWVLLDKIAQVTKTDKESIYRDFVRDYGVFEIVGVKKQAVERLSESWSKNGTGWVALDLGEGKNAGIHNVAMHYGSSTYSTAEMARLIEAVVNTAKDLGIDTVSPKELERMEEQWKRENTK